ncbi:MAG: YceI family protein [Saprospiraceae bacterium]
MPTAPLYLLLYSIYLIAGIQTTPQTYICSDGSIDFHSDAPLESIRASSKQLRGVVKPGNNSFAWTVPIQSFQGFNSQLQREHFNENYMESAAYPTAKFSGRIIEQVDYSKKGTQTIRAKGKLSIHGVEQERIIRCTLLVGPNELRVKSEFSVFLSDHQISIPKIVNQKIATEILINVDAVLTQKPETE